MVFWNICGLLNCDEFIDIYRNLNKSISAHTNALLETHTNFTVMNWKLHKLICHWVVDGSFPIKLCWRWKIPIMFIFISLKSLIRLPRPSHQRVRSNIFLCYLTQRCTHCTFGRYFYLKRLEDMAKEEEYVKYEAYTLLCKWVLSGSPSQV